MDRIKYKELDEVNWLYAMADPRFEFQFVMSSGMENPAGWQGTDDYLAQHLLFFVDSGIIEGMVNGMSISLPPGSMIWVRTPARRCFRLKEDQVKSCNFRIRFNLWSEDSLMTYKAPFLIRHDAWSVRGYFKRLADMRWDKQTYSDIERRAVLHALFAAFFSCGDFDNSTFRKFSSKEIRSIEEQFDANNSDPATLAESFGFTRDYFTRLFKATYGVPPRTFIKQRRLRKAADLLLKTNLTLKEICHQLSEEDIGKFCKQFKDEFGYTPTQYRKMG